MVSWWLLELGQRMIKSNKKKKTLFLINHKKNEEMNGLKYKKLNDFEMSNITGGKWVTKTIVNSEVLVEIFTVIAINFMFSPTLMNIIPKHTRRETNIVTPIILNS